jgi:hypothetical protein
MRGTGNELPFTTFADSVTSPKLSGPFVTWEFRTFSFTMLSLGMVLQGNR